MVERKGTNKKQNKTDKPLGFFKKIWEVSIHPSNFFNTIKKEKGLLAPFIYFLIVIVLVKGLWRIYYMFSLYQYINPAYTAFLANKTYFDVWKLYLLAQIIGIFIVVFIFYLIIRLFKSKGTYEDAFKILVYSSTPQALLGWISPAGFGIWSFVLLIKGMNRTYDLTTWKSIGLFLLSFGVMLAIMFGTMAIYLS